MFRAFFEIRESANGCPRLFKSRIVHIEKQRKIALNYKGLTFGHIQVL